MSDIRKDLDRTLIMLELITAEKIYYIASAFIPKGMMTRMAPSTLLAPFPVWSFHPDDMPTMTELLGDKLVDFRTWKPEEGTP